MMSPGLLVFWVELWENDSYNELVKGVGFHFVGGQRMATPDQIPSDLTLEIGEDLSLKDLW